MASGRTCGQSHLIISPTFFTWVSPFTKIWTVRLSLTYNRFTTLMRISTSVSYRSLKYLFYFSIFESFRRDPSASQLTSSSQWMCVTWSPSYSSPSFSVIQLMQHGSGGMANTRRNVKISTRKDGRQLRSICFSILWLWFCLFASWASYRYPWKRKCNWWLCLLLDSCEFFQFNLRKWLILQITNWEI